MNFLQDMTDQDKKNIVAYLSGPRVWQEGVAIYQSFGVNLRLKKLFMTDDSATTREMLFDELRKIAGLSELEFARLPRRAALRHRSPVPVEVPPVMADGEAAPSSYAEAPEPVRKMIRFRERFPFLSSPDCPDVLKVLVADMFTAYGNYKSAHARLQTLADDESAAAVADCEAVVNGYLLNREIWDELEYYREHGEILGRASKFAQLEAAEDYALLSDLELARKLQSAQSNESKHRRAVTDARERGEDNERAQAALVRWSATKKALQEEVARRKKKVTAGLLKAEKHRASLVRFLSRPGCHPCDRSESGHQLSIINRQIASLNESLSVLASVG